MDRPSHHFFARARFAQDEHGDVRCGGLLCQRELGCELSILADDRSISIVQFTFQDADLTLQRDGVQCLVDHDRDVVAGERFCDEIDGAELHGFDGKFDRAEGG
jgi:hypothetical protein